MRCIMFFAFLRSGLIEVRQLKVSNVTSLRRAYSSTTSNISREMFTATRDFLRRGDNLLLFLFFGRSCFQFLQKLDFLQRR